MKWNLLLHFIVCGLTNLLPKKPLFSFSLRRNNGVMCVQGGGKRAEGCQLAVGFAFSHESNFHLFSWHFSGLFLPFQPKTKKTSKLVENITAVDVEIEINLAEFWMENSSQPSSSSSIALFVNCCYTTNAYNCRNSFNKIIENLRDAIKNQNWIV